MSTIRRLAAGTLVLGLGFGLSLPFQRARAPSGGLAPGTESLSLRGPDVPVSQEARERLQREPESEPGSGSEADLPMVAVPRLESAADVPRLIEEYQPLFGQRQPPAARGESTQLRPPAASARPVEAPIACRAHRIGPRDTLPALAARYLGSADRSWEIFHANRDVLSDPEILPVGREIRIPPRIPPAGESGQMVPIPTGAWK